MDIDANGVVVAVYEGQFDASQWLRQRRSMFESRYAVADYDGRPTVVDMTACRLPLRDWSEHFKQAAGALKERRMKPFRNAFIIGPEPEAEAGLALFAEYQKQIQHPQSEVRTFRIYRDAYAWAIEALGRNAPEAAVPESTPGAADRTRR